MEKTCHRFVTLMIGIDTTNLPTCIFCDWNRYSRFADFCILVIGIDITDLPTCIL